MNRRQFFECAAILISGASVAQLGFSLTHDQQAYLATAPDYTDQKINYLTNGQRRIISAMTEVIIPETDTPGALHAQVWRFVELMAYEWFNEEEKAIFEAGLKDLEVRIPKEFGQPFDQLTGEKQLAILEALEDAATGSSWYELGNVARQFVSDAPFICQIKELTIWGFFSSEMGSRQVLRYDPMPMHFDGDLPRSPDDSSWALGFD